MSFGLIEFEGLANFGIELFLAIEVGLRFEGIMDVHQVYALEPQILFARLQLMLQILGVHAVDLSCNVLFRDEVVFLKFLDEHGRALSIISIVGYVAVLGSDEKFISLDPVLLNKSSNGSSNRPFGLLTPIIDGCVQDVDSATLNKKLCRIVDIKIRVIIGKAEIRSQTNCGKVEVVDGGTFFIMKDGPSEIPQRDVILFVGSFFESLRSFRSASALNHKVFIVQIRTTFDVLQILLILINIIEEILSITPISVDFQLRVLRYQNRLGGTL